MPENKKLRYTLGGNNIDQAEESLASKRDRYKKLLGAYSYKNNPQNASPILSFKNYIDQFTEDSKVQGFDMRKINGLIGNSIANMAVAHEDENILNLIDLIQTGPNSYYSNTVEAQDLVLKAKSEINRLRDAREQRNWTEHQRGRTLGVEHYNTRIGSEKKRYYDNEITWEEFKEQIQPIFSEMSQQGFTDLVDTWETRIRTEDNDREKRGRTIEIGIDSPRADEVVQIAENAQSMSDVRRWQIENGVNLSNEFSQALGSIIEENQGVNFNFMETQEYKNVRSQIEQTLAAPGVERSKVEQILEGLAGTVRDPTPPVYFKEKTAIIANINQKLAKRFREILLLPKGNRSYKNFNEEQASLWRQALTEIPYENLDSDVKRLQNVMDEYNKQITQEARIIRERQASQLNMPELDQILNMDSGEGGRMFGQSIYLERFQYLVTNLFEPEYGFTGMGFGKNSLATYLDNRIKNAGYQGIEDPSAKALLKEEINYINSEIMRLTK